MKFFVTGAAGFIGSNLCDRLIEDGHIVIGYDNLSTGQEKFLEKAIVSKQFKLVIGDLLDSNKLNENLDSDVDAVFHFAANADIKDGLKHPDKDLQQNTIATFNVLEAMRLKGVKKILFSSTGSVYGESTVFPTPEDVAFPIQTSLYAASKVAGENLIQAYCEGFGFRSWIFRFVSILGERYTHGHVFDFYKKLMANQTELEVLGNGLQRKSYLYVGDCLDAVLAAFYSAKDKVNIFNLGTEEVCQVNDSIALITQQLGVKPELKYTGGERGWVGDNPFILLDIKRIKSLGWEPKHTIEEGIIKTVEYLQNNNWVFTKRN